MPLLDFATTANVIEDVVQDVNPAFTFQTIQESIQPKLERFTFQSPELTFDLNELPSSSKSPYKVSSKLLNY